MGKNLFKKKKVVVMGIGLHGGNVATIQWLSSQGAKVIATDKKSKDDLASSLEKIKGLKNVTIVTGQHRMEDFESADLVIKNPVVKWSDKYIQAALKRNIPVEMDSSLFLTNCPSRKIIGITGTKGKTTTSLLIAKMLEMAGKEFVKVGIGQEAVMNKLEKIKKNTWVIFELSSWRLSALAKHKISPRIAVVTNIFPDHLNYYATMEEYVDDKKLIFLNQKSNGKLILNWDNELAKNFESEAKGVLAYFSLEKIDENICVYIEGGVIKYNNDGEIGKICKTEEARLRGSHNLYNALAACAVAILARVSPSNIKEALVSFKGFPHRLEFVDKVGGVKFFNDTTATTPESGIAGINSFSKHINLICGGSNKKLDLRPLANKIVKAKHVSTVFLLKGSATDELKKLIIEFGGASKIAGVYSGMKDAVEDGAQFASSGEIVLLSPGCASFGMFKNEFDRGNQFKDIVKKMKKRKKDIRPT
ncbi:MAG: UDP-N-acetylmuramoyl-L-alanine--D-glutamate ligase [Patescibacteria group bacterium]|nr:UDP-N-acetylmuramoyl-L-alanine--D-glutamate ligase [Patescibacteria group bacterium]